MDGMFGLGLERFETYATPTSPERTIVVRALLLTLTLAVLTVGGLVTLDAFGVTVPVVTEFPALDGGAV